MIAACLISCYVAGGLLFTSSAESEHIHAESNIHEFIESFADCKIFN